MNIKPLVSVIIPFFNRFNLVKESIKNISLQTYQNIEVILVDDGSDNVIAIEDDFGLDIQLKRLEENKGPGYARREGRLLAKGKYICYLDSDDWWSNNFIEECVKTIESDMTLGMVYSNTIRIVDGIETHSRVKGNGPISILPTLFLNTKRFWSTPSCLWRNNVSLADHWLPYRNHEDYLHDIYCSIVNNKIKFVSGAQTYNNHSARNRIVRDSEEVRKALKEIIQIEGLSNKHGLSYFFLNRVYKNKLRIELKHLPIILKLPSREFRVFSSNWFLFYKLVLLNMLKIKYKYQKINIKRLKL